MNVNAPCNALVPAAEKAEQREAGLESLQAGLAEVFAGFPLLLNLLMRLFALLRAAAARRAQDDVAPAVEAVMVVAPSPVVKQAVRSVAKRRAARKARRVARVLCATRVPVGRRVDRLEPAKRSGQTCCAPRPFRRRRSKPDLCAAKTHVHFVTIS